MSLPSSQISRGQTTSQRSTSTRQARPISKSFTAPSCLITAMNFTTPAGMPAAAATRTPPSGETTWLPQAFTPAVYMVRWEPITETNRKHLILFVMHHRTFGPYLVAINRILNSVSPPGTGPVAAHRPCSSGPRGCCWRQRARHLPSTHRASVLPACHVADTRRCAAAAAFDVGTNPRAPALSKVVEPAEVLGKTGLGWLHTTHCLGTGEVVIRCVCALHQQAGRQADGQTRMASLRYFTCSPR
jgi:56kDa selenium binding protein (SBP56)